MAFTRFNRLKSSFPRSDMVVLRWREACRAVDDSRTPSWCPPQASAVFSRSSFFDGAVVSALLADGAEALAVAVADHERATSAIAAAVEAARLSGAVGLG